MKRIIGIILTILGIAIICWNVSASQTSLKHTKQVHEAFNELREFALSNPKKINNDFYEQLQKTRFKSIRTNFGLKDEWESSIRGKVSKPEGKLAV